MYRLRLSLSVATVWILLSVVTLYGQKYADTSEPGGTVHFHSMFDVWWHILPVYVDKWPNIKYDKDVSLILYTLFDQKSLDTDCMSTDTCSVEGKSKCFGMSWYFRQSCASNFVATVLTKDLSCFLVSLEKSSWLAKVTREPGLIAQHHGPTSLTLLRLNGIKSLQP